MIGQIVLWLLAGLLGVVVVGGGVSVLRQDVRDLRSTPKGGK